VESDDQLLREKARLLLQRERELFELRLKFDQLATWLSLGQALPEQFLHRGTSKEDVWNHIRKTLITKLRLQRVLLLEIGATTLVALAPRGDERPLSAEARALLDARAGGLCNDPKADANPPGIAPLAETLGLHQFIWSRIARSHRSPILMVAGFDEARAAFQSPFLENEAAYFSNTAQHVESLLANALLVAELEKEKEQLRQANVTLEQRDQALQDAARTLLAVNETLEQRVRDRTQELATKNRELRDLPRRIQTSILPTCAKAPSVTISARMAAAEEVGGDYYDVLPAVDGAWIAVGDVSGHGLQAGLITFMLQSAVATLTAARPDARPSEIVTLLNAIIYKNIRERLLSDDHVTFVLLRVFADGRMLFAGSHEDLLIRRARSGLCEIISTSGTWLGAIPDIRRVTTDSEVHLDVGDVIVAYTDGIVESRDAAGKIFGLERLRSEIADSGGQSIDELRERIWRKLHAFCPTPEDDVSLVIVRFDGAPNPSE
jgi:serine phosphatase RsbU (regulator of sigma subunit)